MTKIITKKNWRDIDPDCSIFLYLESSDGTAAPIFPNLWLQLVLEPRLSKSVPKDVQELMEVARSALLYGAFYYPLFAHGIDQLHRVGEAAISHKYELCSGPSNIDGRRPTFARKIRWLFESGIIDKEEKQGWWLVKQARNDGSHLFTRKMLAPGLSMMILQNTVHRINLLFSREQYGK